jgi:thioredoxin-like negative regulator of GroEL
MEANLVDVSMGHSMLAKFYKIDTDFNPDAAEDFQVRSIPSTLFFKGGRLVSEIVGTVNTNVVVSQLTKHNVVAPAPFN